MAQPTTRWAVVCRAIALLCRAIAHLQKNVCAGPLRLDPGPTAQPPCSRFESNTHKYVAHAPFSWRLSRSLAESSVPAKRARGATVPSTLAGNTCYQTSGPSWVRWYSCTFLSESTVQLLVRHVAPSRACAAACPAADRSTAELPTNVLQARACRPGCPRPHPSQLQPVTD